ncbi:MAG: recombinase family protein [Lentisphaeria bacterium]|nr:recombinase family protein [Lentisphaeria bacterium]
MGKTLKLEPKKYCLYARVSPKGSDWGAEETSIAVQLSDMRKRVLTICPNAEFIELADEFKSGKDLNRPGIQQILEDLNKPQCPWQCLVVWNLDRLSRSLKDAIPIFSKLRDANCEFISINQDYLSYTGAMARFMLHQTIAIAELERGMTAERVSAKLRGMVQAGKYPSGRVPIGYKKTDKYTVVIDEDKAPMIRDIFSLFNEGKLGFEEVNKRYPGVFQNRQHFYRILRNKLYIGVLVWNGVEYPGICDPIIDAKTFDNVQMLLQESRRNYTRTNGKQYEYLLSGLVYCHCGRHMTPYSVNKGDNKRFFYYKCTAPECKNAINAESLDNEVLEYVAQIFQDEDEIKASLEAYLKEMAEETGRSKAQKANLEMQLSEARKREQNIANMFLNGIVTQENKDYWNAELANARATREELEKQIEELSPQVPSIDYEQIMPNLVEAAKRYARKIIDEKDSNEARRNLIYSTVESVTCLNREQNVITFELRLVMTGSKVWRRGGDSNPR